MGIKVLWPALCGMAHICNFTLHEGRYADTLSKVDEQQCTFVLLSFVIWTSPNLPPNLFVLSEDVSL